MKRQPRKSSLSKKATRLKRSFRGTARNAAGFVPGLGTVLGIRDTTNSSIKTVRAADDYLNELSKEAKRRIRKYI